MLVTLWGGLSPHRHHLISANPSGGVGHQPLSSSHGDSACWIETGNGLAAQLVAAGFECPIPWGTGNIPLVQAFWFLLGLRYLWLS